MSNDQSASSSSSQPMANDLPPSSQLPVDEPDHPSPPAGVLADIEEETFSGDDVFSNVDIDQLNREGKHTFLNSVAGMMILTTWSRRSRTNKLHGIPSTARSAGLQHSSFDCTRRYSNKQIQWPMHILDYQYQFLASGLQYRRWSKLAVV